MRLRDETGSFLWAPQPWPDRRGVAIDPSTSHRLAARTPNLLVNGNSALVVWTDWALPWFECPLCGRRCRHVYLLDPIACRRCHRLDYASRHLYRQTPAVHRVARLRRKLGADLRPFAPL